MSGVEVELRAKMGFHRVRVTIFRSGHVAEQLFSSDDNSGLFNKKSVLQTKYRQLFMKNRPNTDRSF